MNTPEMTELLRHHLLPMVAQGIDYLVLGCTHYPYLLPQIQQLIPPHIKVIDSGYAVAKQTRHILEEHNLLNDTDTPAQHFWYANGKAEVLQQFAPDINNLQISVL